MANYANQRFIDLDQEQMEQLVHHKDEPTDGYYPPLEYKYVNKAAELLNGNAFKIWMYMLQWRGKGQVDFSPADVDKRMKIKKSSVNDSWKELEQQGFLHYMGGNKYKFTPISNKQV